MAASTRYENVFFFNKIVYFSLSSNDAYFALFERRTSACVWMNRMNRSVAGEPLGWRRGVSLALFRSIALTRTSCHRWLGSAYATVGLGRCLSRCARTTPDRQEKNKNVIGNVSNSLTLGGSFFLVDDATNTGSVRWETLVRSTKIFKITRHYFAAIDGCAGEAMIRTVARCDRHGHHRGIAPAFLS